MQYMGSYRKEGHLLPFYHYEEVKVLGGLNLYRQCCITESLQNYLDMHVEVGTIVRLFIMHGVL